MKQIDFIENPPIILTLDGNIISKKNSNVFNRNTGTVGKTRNFNAWHRKALRQMIKQRDELIKPNTHITHCDKISFELTFGSNTRTDADNKITSCLDLLQDAFIMEDDRWQVVPKLYVQSRFEKGSWGAVIVIHNPTYGEIT